MLAATFLEWAHVAILAVQVGIFGLVSWNHRYVKKVDRKLNGHLNGNDGEPPRPAP